VTNPALVQASMVVKSMEAGTFQWEAGAWPLPEGGALELAPFSTQTVP